MTENKLIEQRARGEKAKGVLENDLVIEAFEKIEADLNEMWQKSEMSQHEERENIYLAMRIFKNFRAYFSKVVRTGDAAAKELVTIQKKARARRANV